MRSAASSARRRLRREVATVLADILRDPASAGPVRDLFRRAARRDRCARRHPWSTAPATLAIATLTVEHRSQQTALAFTRSRSPWRCRRETPITAVAPDGTVLEGVLDLAFEEDAGWTVVDFKTEAEVAGLVARYRRQVGAYASMVARVTGRPATAVLLRL